MNVEEAPMNVQLLKNELDRLKSGESLKENIKVEERWLLISTFDPKGQVPNTELAKLFRVDEKAIRTARKVLNGEVILEINLADIQPLHFNPNRMADEDFERLKLDIEAHGSRGMDPILVRPNFLDLKAPYGLVDGHHRLQVFEALGWEKIPARITIKDDLEALIVNFRKNSERGSIDPFKLADLFTSLHEEKGLSDSDIAERNLSQCRHSLFKDSRVGLK